MLPALIMIDTIIFRANLREARKARRRRREAGRRREVVVRIDAQAVERPVGGGDQNAPGGGVHEIARGRAEFAGRARRAR